MPRFPSFAKFPRRHHGQSTDFSVARLSSGVQESFFLSSRVHPAAFLRTICTQQAAISLPMDFASISMRRFASTRDLSILQDSAICTLSVPVGSRMPAPFQHLGVVSRNRHPPSPSHWWLQVHLARSCMGCPPSGLGTHVPRPAGCASSLAVFPDETVVLEPDCSTALCQEALACRN
jgi:hypothetical protein